MRLNDIAIAIAAGIILGAAEAAAQTVASGGFTAPESARYDSWRDRWLVSNFGASGEDDGFISVLHPSGEVAALKWIASGERGVRLADPLGIAITEKLIYVADGTFVRAFDGRSGALSASFEAPGAVRLNDLAIAPDGALLVTDSGADDRPGAIYRISAAGDVSEFAPRAEALNRPNGIAVLGDGTVVHGGRSTMLSFRDPQGRLVREVTLPTGRIDGVIPAPDGGLLVASLEGRCIYRLDPETWTPVVVVRDIAFPAAIGFDAGRRRMAIPQVRENSVTFVDLP